MPDHSEVDKEGQNNIIGPSKKFIQKKRCLRVLLRTSIYTDYIFHRIIWWYDIG